MKSKIGWFIRCEANGRPLEFQTAYPLPRQEWSAAKILARHDLTRIIDPRGAVLVWLEEEVVVETHNLQPVTKPRSALDYELDLILRMQHLEPGEEAGRNKDSRDE